VVYVIPAVFELPGTVEIEDFEMVLKNVGCRNNINWMVMLNHIATYYIYCQPHSSD
jgi:hypothetical protein